MEKQLRSGSAVRDVSPAGGHLDRHQRPWPWAGDDAGAHPDEPDHFQPAPLDAGGNPYSDLRHDHRFGGERLAYAFGLYQSLGIFIPLIVTNCIVVGRAEAFAAKKGPALSALDGFSIGMGATCAMFVLGSMREILGNGTLFDGADSLLGSWAKVLRIEVFHTDTPFLLAMLPPGAFIGLGMMLAVKYLIDERSKQRKAKAVQADVVAPSDVTGKAWNE